MRRYFQGALSASVLFFCGNVTRSEPPLSTTAVVSNVDSKPVFEPAARELLTQALAAAGKDASVLHAAYTWKATGEEVQKDHVYDIDFEVAFAPAESLRFRMRRKILATTTTNTYTVTANDAWTRIDLTPPRDMRPDRRLEMQTLAHLEWLKLIVPVFNDGNLSVRIRPDETIDRQVYNVLRVSRDQHEDVEILIDPKTKLVARMRTRVAPEPGARQLSPLVCIYSDYKEVDGRQLPHRVEVLRDDKPLYRLTQTGWKTLSTVPAGYFDRPQ